MTVRGTGAKAPTSGIHGISDQPGGASTEITHVGRFSAGPARFHTPRIPKGVGTLTLEQYKRWLKGEEY